MADSLGSGAVSDRTVHRRVASTVRSGHRCRGRPCRRTPVVTLTIAAIASARRAASIIFEKKKGHPATSPYNSVKLGQLAAGPASALASWVRDAPIRLRPLRPCRQQESGHLLLPHPATPVPPTAHGTPLRALPRLRVGPPRTYYSTTPTPARTRRQEAMSGARRRVVLLLSRCRPTACRDEHESTHARTIRRAGGRDGTTAAAQVTWRYENDGRKRPKHICQ